MATITDQELEAEFDQFGVELGDLMVIEKCKLFICLVVDLCSKVKHNTNEYILHKFLHVV